MTRPRNRPPGCFFLIFLLMGLAGTGLFGGLMIWPVLWARLTYVETNCLILDKRIDQRQDEEGPTFLAQIHIEYTVNGVVHRIWTYDAAGVFSNVRSEHERVLRQFEKGERHPCWYDPKQPGKAVLTRRFSPWSLMVLIPVVFALIGAGGLIGNRRKPPDPPAKALPGPAQPDRQWPLNVRVLLMFFGGFIVAAILSFTLVFNLGIGGPFWLNGLLFFGPFFVYTILFGFYIKRMMPRLKRALPSPERSAATTLTRPEAPEEEAEQTGQDWPTIPSLEPPPRPGNTLAHRLESSNKPVWFLIISLALACFWNGIVSVFLYTVVDGHLQGKPNWWLTVFLIPFVIIGLVLIVLVLTAVVGLVISLLIGRVRVEIGNHPLRAGQPVEFLVEQSGLFVLRRMRLTLVCTESATYTAGTRTNTDTRDVLEAEVAGPAPNLDGREGQGLHGTFTAPAEAMHSFQAMNNRIDWKLRVTGRGGGFLPYSSDYPVILHPEE